MTPMVRMRSPMISLHRQRRPLQNQQWFLWKQPSIGLLVLTVIFASMGCLFLTEMVVMQKRAVTMPGRHFTRLNQHTTGTNLDRRWIAPRRLPSVPSPATIIRGDDFRIEPLLRRNSLSVELSAQMQLNSLATYRIRMDIERYHKVIQMKVMANLTQNATTTMLFHLTDSGQEFEDEDMPWTTQRCPDYPPFLAPPRVVDSTETLPLSRIPPLIGNQITNGGSSRPKSCLSQFSVAIVIPYRDRWLHLTTLMNHLHPLLQHQLIQYKMFVVEQYGNETFNKGALMNAAFMEVLRTEFFHCFIFHDVDLIPENEYNMYTCPQMPRHLSVAVNELHYKLPYDVLVGGVLAIRTEHFTKVNGYSNLFWGWGGEDDDMGMRIQQAGLQITRPIPDIGRYTMIKHVKRKRIERKVRFKLVRTAKRRYRLDGLNTAQYRLVEKKIYDMFTTFVIDVGDPPEALKAK